MPNHKYKPIVVRINLSDPFVIRARCKFCGDPPSMYYFVRNPTLWYNPHKVTDMDRNWNKYWTRMCSDYYLTEEPKYFTKINYFSWRKETKSYNPKLHRTKNANPLSSEEFLTCECGRTVWAFTDKANRSRKEITNRKSKGNFPHKFLF